MKFPFPHVLSLRTRFECAFWTAAIVGFLASLSVSRGDTLVTYDFAGGSGTASSFGTGLLSASTFTPRLGSGGTLGLSTSGDAFSRLQSSITNPTLVMPSTLDAATAGNWYFDFVLTPSSTINLGSLSFEAHAFNISGGTTYGDYTVNFNLSLISNNVLTNVGNLSYAAAAFQGVHTYPTVSESFDLSAFRNLTSPETFRITLFRDPATVTNYYETIRIDNVLVTNAVPEAATVHFLLGGGSVLAFMGMLRRRSRKSRIALDC